MALRVTQTMMSSQMLSNINHNLNGMNKLQNQLSTGKAINKPSDDPVGITFALRYRGEISSNDQYTDNADAAMSSLEYMDTTIGQATDIVQRFRELIVKGANGTLEQTSLDAIKTEVSQLYNQMVEIGNGQFNGKQMFNGEQTGVKPYSAIGLDQAIDPLAVPPQTKASSNQTDNGSINYELSPGMTMEVNMTGNEVFGEPVTDPNDTSSDNLFQLMQRAYDMLGSGDQTGLSGLLGQIDTRMDSMLTARAQIGARVNRVEIIQGRLSDVDTNLQSMQQKVEDVDMAQAITNMTTLENVYQASLSAGAKIIQPSLVDFLR
ncbi:flagellar hook-associated protein FlgL [Paenibacillus glycanilyticus]|uniref:Flagellar hook-associated protein FlgL n=1 Tax=Paenibacillus glycanilyticus TaxID=126569 RepID=A0ABQ6GNH2_9BACL|nr:flagellar hook-associated protein FlgL [Paenibacillus glycanilyticus]GLX70886.1 flagellar hook-associated protein FlgL [Paenibacillus glycanilyticus]